MWKKLKKLYKEENGAVVLEYLILALLITSVAAAIVAGIIVSLKSTHNSLVDEIITITGSGY